MEYKVIATGSSGNAVLIEDVLVDCGISYTRLKDYLPKVNYLIITHIHTDHLNKSTYNRIRRLHPRIVVIGNTDVAQTVKVDIISGNGMTIRTKDYDFEAWEVPHDVLNHAYIWNNSKGERVLYCTDTASTKPLPQQKYDWFFLESNHDERKLELARGQARKYGYDAYSGGKRHLSTQQAKAFYYMHRRERESPWVELHMSSRFY